MEAIILAGGLGTRLRGVISDLPKPMAPIRDQPFLAILLDELIAAGFTKSILAVGYRHDAIRNYFGTQYRSLRLNYSVEPTPLGTGGAIRLALEKTTAPQVFVVNGDTYLELDYKSMLNAHLEKKSILTVAVQRVADASRYGALEIEEGRIQGFFEKGRSGAGLINGGVYLLSPALFDRFALPDAFSFELDLLVSHIKELRPLAFQAQGTFIDIGIPEDYARAQEILRPDKHSEVS